MGVLDIVCAEGRMVTEADEILDDGWSCAKLMREPDDVGGIDVSEGETRSVERVAQRDGGSERAVVWVLR